MLGPIYSVSWWLLRCLEVLYVVAIGARQLQQHAQKPPQKVGRFTRSLSLICDTRMVLHASPGHIPTGTHKLTVVDIEEWGSTVC